VCRCVPFRSDYAAPAAYELDRKLVTVPPGQRGARELQFFRAALINTIFADLNCFNRVLFDDQTLVVLKVK